ncbi:syntaxin-1A-like [Gastrophryne carolinensis]
MFLTGVRMRDRLEELRSRTDRDDSLELEDSLAFDNPAFQDSEANHMNVFFQEVAGLWAALRSLKGQAQDIAQKQEEVLCSTTEAKISDGKKELGRMKEQLTSNAKVIQAQLGSMKNSLAQDNRSWTAEHRIRQGQFNVLTGRFREVMSHHYASETRYVGRLKEQIARQAELAGLDLREDEIDRLIGSDAAPQIVGHDLDILKAKRHLALAQQRHKQLLDLEAQIGELHALFLQLELLASEQHEVVNSIEYNVLRTMDYISQSNEQVKKAIKYQQKSRLAAAISAVLGLCACCTCISCTACAVR